MSGNGSPSETDRRVRRTRRALLDAFRELVLRQRYDEIGVADIVAGADVGRSTFYAHYGGKDDLLVQSMGPLLDVLADAASEEGDVLRLEHVLAHFEENRVLARQLLCGQSSAQLVPRIVQALAERVERRLEARLARQPSKPLLPPRLLAAHTAEAQLGLIRAWLAGASPSSPRALALGLRAATLAGVAALLGG